MTLKEFGEEANIHYQTTVFVNDKIAGMVSGSSQESLIEGYRKLDRAVNDEITRQFEDLPEPIEDEDRGVSDVE